MCRFQFLFIYAWLLWVLAAPHRLSLVAGSRGTSSWDVRLPLLWSTGSAVGRPQELWHTGLAAPWHVGSFRTRDHTHFPCMGRWILNHGPPRKSTIFIIRTPVAGNTAGKSQPALFWVTSPCWSSHLLHSHGSRFLPCLFPPQFIFTCSTLCFNINACWFKWL